MTFACLTVLSSTGGSVTPYAQRQSLAINELRLKATSQGSVEEISCDLKGTYDNPFDPSDISLDVEVMSPTGKPFTIPGYFDPKDSSWKIRILATEAGAYKLQLIAKDRSGTQTKGGSFEATASVSPGVLTADSTNVRAFSFANKKSYFPIGTNSPTDHIPNESELKQLANSGANLVRISIAPSSPFAIEKPGRPEKGAGLGVFEADSLLRIDSLFADAAKANVNIMLCLNAGKDLRGTQQDNNWDQSVYSRESGGPLRVCTDFWGDPAVDEFVRAKLRYLVARYGASPNLFSWELWDEVDQASGFQIGPIREWHQKFGRCLRSLDPYHHPITTSFADPMGDRAVDLLPELDFVQSHSVGAPDPVAEVAYQESRKAEWGKPHFFGALGSARPSSRADQDPQGMSIHDSTWASIATGASGGALARWYPTEAQLSSFTGATTFLHGIDWGQEDFRPTNLTITYADSSRAKTFGDLVIDNGDAKLVPGPPNQPQAATIANGKLSGDRPSGLLHGVEARLGLHNPILFNVNFAKPTKFTVEVGAVSLNGARLQIRIDGDPVLTRDFPATVAATGDSSLAYRGSYSATIPEGTHKVVVENLGRDWSAVQYRFDKVIPQTTPDLSAWAVLGNQTAIAWLRVRERTLRNVLESKRTISPIDPSVIGLSGLAAGRWKVELWDTWKGTVNSSSFYTVGIDGRIRISLPSIATDLAIKLIKT